MKKLSLLFLCCILYSCHQEQDMTVHVDFSLHNESQFYTAPLAVSVENRTTNAHSYLWTFEGGQPATSRDKLPGTVFFAVPGEYRVTLEAWNDGSRVSKTETLRVDSAVVADFEVMPEINHYAPAKFNIKNLSSGGSAYKWTFEGGTPADHTGENPPAISYEDEGLYMIKLEVNNGSQTFLVEKELEVGPRLQADFEIIPSFEDEDDMEAPLRATFKTSLKGVERLRWMCTEAEISDETLETASIYFAKEGVYSVLLEVSNGKNAKTVTQEITVKKNSNLRTHENVRLGINTAHSNYPMYYSTRLRRSIQQEEINAETAGLIDLVFFGLNANFTRNFFASPADLSNTTFPEIPGALPTKFINKTETGGVHMTPGEFEAMTTDEKLRALPIASGMTGDQYFSNDVLPRVVLFETGDGRKGAVLIKDMIRDGREKSHIVVDIKVQKND